MSVSERCEVAFALGVADLNAFRLAFCLVQREATSFTATSLDLSRCGLVTLNGLQPFALYLVSLDVSNNSLASLEPAVFDFLTALRYLDLRDNSIDATLDELLHCKTHTHARLIVCGCGVAYGS